MYKVIQTNGALFACEINDLTETDHSFKSKKFINLIIQETHMNNWNQLFPQIKNNKGIFKLQEKEGMVTFIIISSYKDNKLTNSNYETELFKNNVISTFILNEEVEKWVRSYLSDIVIPTANVSTKITQFPKG